MLDASDPVQLVDAEISELSTPISRGKRPKFSKRDKEAIGSFDSIDLVTYLGRPADFLSRMLRAADEFKPVRTDADRAALKQIDREERDPNRKEERKQAVRTNSAKAQKRAHTADRLELVQYLKTLNAYRGLKECIPQGLRTAARMKAAAIKAHQQVEPTREAEVRRSKKRGRPKDEGRHYVRGHRKQFGWKGRNVNKGVQSNWLAGDYSFWQGQEGAAFIGTGGFASISELDIAYPHARDRQMREVELSTKKLKLELRDFYDRRSEEESALSKVFDDPKTLEGKHDEDESE